MKLLPTKEIPISFFAMTMAFFGLALAWKLSGLSVFISTLLACVAVIAFLLVSVSYSVKIVKYRADVMLELKHPITMNFFATATVSIMFFGSILSSYMPTLATSMWILGTALQSILVLHTLGQWLFHKAIELEHITPACFMPVVGMAFVPIYGAAHGFVEISWFFWSIGLSLWMILLVIVFYKLMLISPLPPSLMPTMFILLAPPSVIFSGYINLTGTGIDVFSNVIYFLAFFLFFLLLSQIKQYKVPFSMSYWAFTFPVIAFSMATMLMGKTIENTFVLYFGYGILFCVSIVVSIVLALTIKNVILRTHQKA